MTRTLRALLLIVLSAVAGCATTSSWVAGRSRPEAWRSSLFEANAEADAGHLVTADSVLIRFAEANPGTPEAMEANYWRALFRLDPRYGANGPREALPLLDLYLAGNTPRERRHEAVALKRVAEVMEGLNSLLSVTASRAESSTQLAADARAQAAGARADARAATADVSALDAEIRKLKGELAKANEELERIRKRLAEVLKKGGG